MLSLISTLNQYLKFNFFKSIIHFYVILKNFNLMSNEFLLSFVSTGLCLQNTILMITQKSHYSFPIRVITLIFTRRYPYSARYPVLLRVFLKFYAQKKSKHQRKNIRVIMVIYTTTHNYGKLRVCFRPNFCRRAFFTYPSY